MLLAFHVVRKALDDMEGRKVGLYLPTVRKVLNCKESKGTYRSLE